MELSFPVHFQQRIMERSIDVDHIKQAIKSPDIASDSFGERKVVIKSIENKKIKVAYIKNSKNIYTIITAYYLNNK